MKLLHGTNEIIHRPDISKCKSKNDFGKGFYLTPSWNRAWEMGRKAFENFHRQSISIRQQLHSILLLHTKSNGYFKENIIMSEQTVKIDSLLSELGVYLVSKYGMNPRDAVGMVMQSSLAEEISKPDSILLDASVEQLAAALL